MARGKFIVIEGGDGAGKDTQAALLEEKYGNRSDVLFVRDPGGTDTALAIRKLILADYPVPLTPKTELLLFLAARSQLVDELIAPALKEGKHVICQRFALSTIAYQLYGREQLGYRGAFNKMNAFAASDTTPDLYILLDVEAAVGMQRTKDGKRGNRDRFETEARAFHERVCAAYRSEIAKYKNHLVIDANKSIEEVHRDILVALAPLISDVVRQPAEREASSDNTSGLVPRNLY